MLANRIEAPFLELDRLIEQESGVSLSVIFDLYGQSGFRRLERRVVDQVIERYPRFVLATGGSLVSEPATFERLLTMCFTVWLRATPEEHMQRVIAQGDMRPWPTTANPCRTCGAFALLTPNYNACMHVGSRVCASPALP